MQADLLSAILATVGSVSFAFTGISIRKATVTGNPLDAALSSVGFNLLVFLPLGFFYAVYYHNFSFSVSSFLPFVASGLVANFLARVCYFEGTKRIGASRSTPISRGSLLVSTILGVLILGEAIAGGHLIGVLLIATGIIVVGRETGLRGEKKKLSSSLDLLFPLASMFLYGLALIFDKIGLSGDTPIVVGLSIKFSAALLGLIIYFVFKGRSISYPFRSPERKLYFIAGITSAVALGLLYSAVSLSRVVVVTPFWNLCPLFVLILSFFLLKKLERITWILVMGSVLVVAGSVFVGLFM